MRPRFPLFTKILLWFFLNLLVLGGLLFAFFNLQFRLDPRSILQSEAGNRLEALVRLITDEVAGNPRAERDAILKRYGDAYQVEFLLFANTGEQLGGTDTTLPAEVLRELKVGPPSGAPPPPLIASAKGSGPAYRVRFSQKSANPTRYWYGVAMPVFEPSRTEGIRATLIVMSDSRSGHGLFFDPRPWVVIVAFVLVLSILLWLPFVRSLTRAIKQTTAAAEQIAEEHFEVRVDERRSDELGRLGKAINHLAGRLSGFVQGQRRFLGDVSHELNSPLARMQFALSILEQRVDPAQRHYIEDVQEEVQLMSRLVSELLAYSKAGMRGPQIELEKVGLRPLVERVIERETTPYAHINVEVDAALAVTAQPELLARALGNLLRNAARYAAAAGPITVAAERRGEQVKLCVNDCGPGVPEEALHKIFDPFYRLEVDRARTTGGAGLGLAIVKTCVETCQGSVAARNLKPSGFEVAITLNAAA
jgi:two-component system, OmpR family, sensor histidine kinase CpxA